SRFGVRGSNLGTTNLGTRNLGTTEPGTRNFGTWNLLALSRNLLRLLVVAEPEIDRLTQDPIRRPLGEPHLRDQLGLHPVRRLVLRHFLTERRRPRFERREEGHHALEFLAIEPGAHVADIAKLAALV